MTSIPGLFVTVGSRSGPLPSAAPQAADGFAGLLDALAPVEAPESATPPAAAVAPDDAGPEDLANEAESLLSEVNPDPLTVAVHPVAVDLLPPRASADLRITGSDATVAESATPVGLQTPAQLPADGYPASAFETHAAVAPTRPGQASEPQAGLTEEHAGSPTTTQAMPPTVRLPSPDPVPGEAARPAGSGPGQRPPVPPPGTVEEAASPPAGTPANSTEGGPALTAGPDAGLVADAGLRRANRIGIRILRSGTKEVAAPAANLAARPEALGQTKAEADTPVAKVEIPGPVPPAPGQTAPGRELPTVAGSERAAASQTSAAGLESAPFDARVEHSAPAPHQTAPPQAGPPAEGAPPARSPLVQAALDRVLPLPAAAGETVVRLNPQGLGLIEVVVQERRDGTLDVTLRVQNPLVLDAMRQERDAVAQAVASGQGGSAGSLSMDLFQSGTGQRGPEPEARPFRALAGETDPGPQDGPPEETAAPILRADRVNIVT